MATPTLVKVWNYDVSNVETFSTLIEHGQKMVWNIKEALVAAGWVVVASSNASSVVNIGGGSPDLWIASTDAHRASSGVHSWVAIYNSTLDLTVLLDYISSYDYNCDFVVIDGAVNADGTTSLRPTSVSSVEKEYLNMEVCPGRTSSATQFVWHLWYSSGDKAVRFVARSNGSSPGWVGFFIQEPSNVPDLWLDPVVFSFDASATSEIEWLEAQYYNDNIHLTARVNGDMSYEMYISAEAFDTGAAPAPHIATTSPCDLSSDAGYLMGPMGLIGEDVGVRGSNGRLDDMWWAPVAMSVGDTVMVSASRDFICLSDFMFPWNNTVPVIS